MSSQPKVYIILVNYNGYKDTIECLQSLREITYSNYRVIVVDNASTNDSVKIIKAFMTEDREILLPSEINGGFSAGNNTGIRFALEYGADYCLLLNNDTIVEPDFLDKLIDGFKYSNKCGLTIGKILYEADRSIIWYAGGSLDRRSARTQHLHYREKDYGLSDEPMRVTFATGCCMCLSRKTIEKAGLMDETYFLYEEDADYSCRIVECGFELVYIPQARIYHKVSASTGKQSNITQYYSIRNKYAFIDKKCKSRYAKIYTTVKYIYRCLTGENNFNAFFAAYKAYRNGETGKAV